MTQETLKLLAIGKARTARMAQLDLLRQAGFAVDDAETSEAAFEHLAKDSSSENYGLAVIDCPSMDAEAQEICQRLKAAYPKISTLITVTAPLETKSAAVFATHADMLLFEPIAPLELITSARTLLRLSKSEPAFSTNSGTLSPSGLLHAQLTALYDSSVDGIVGIDNDGVIISWNTAAEQLSGYRSSEILGKSLPDIQGTDEELKQRHIYLQRLQDGEPIEYQALRTRKDGEQIEVWIKGAPVKAPGGATIGAVFFIRDITALKRREQHVHFLMRELTHRSKNLLAVIQAMARQSLSHLNSPEDFVTRFSARLSGLAGSHDLLSNVDWQGASLIDLIRSQLRHHEDRFDEKIHIDGPDLFLRPEAAQNIGIALHELSTNAVKYGALSVPEGNVSIAWTLKTEKDVLRLQMIWHEKGGPPVNPPSRKGFGHVVMDRVTGQALGGTSHAEFNPDGVKWTLDVPASSVVLDREKQA